MSADRQIGHGCTSLRHPFIALWKIGARFGEFRLKGLIPLLLFVCGQVDSTGAARPHELQFWNVAHGLPHNSVSSIAQTEEGFLWVGTRNGLGRLDGVRCVVFNQQTDAELSSSEVTALHTAPGFGLLAGFADGSVISISNSVKRIMVSHDRGLGPVRSIAVQPKGELLVGSEKGLWRIGVQTNVTAIRQGFSVRALMAQPSGVVWVGGDDGLWRFETNTLSAAAPRSAEISTLAADPQGGLWIGGASFGLLQASGRGDAPRRAWPAGSVKALHGGEEEVWFSDGGSSVQKLSSTSGALETIDVAGQNVRCLFQDREGHLWIGTDNAGVALVRQPEVELLEAPQRGGGFLSVTEGANGGVWVCSEAGVLFGLQGERFFRIEANGVPEGAVFETVFASRSDRVWAGTRFHGLFQWNGAAEGRFEKQSGTIGIYALFEDSKSRLWIASTQDGVVLLERGNTKTLYAPQGDPIRDATSFAEDSRGGIWIGTRRSGMFRWRENRIEEYGSVRSRVHQLHVDGRGELWAATEGGLWLIQEGGPRVFSSREGLQDDHLLNVLDDERGNFILASPRAVFKVRQQELDEVRMNTRAAVNSRVLGAHHGMIESSLNEPSAWKGSSLLFAARNTLLRVPSRADALPPLHVLVEEAQVDGRGLLPSGSGQSMAVPANYRQLRLRFSAPAFNAPERVQFRYRLSNFDQEWAVAGSDRSATYGKLPAGAYRFEVHARRENGPWIEPGAGMTLQVAPLYWETNWFRGLIAASVLAGAAFIWRERRARERELGLLRQQIMRDLHDDLGSNLGSIALLSEALQKQPPSGGGGEMLREIHRIARETLDSMRDAVWFVDPEKDTAADLAQYLRRVAEGMLRSTPHHFNAPEKLDPAVIPLQVKREVVLIFKEALHNIVKHGRPSQVEIQLELQRALLELHIRDNGIGFDPQNASHKGHGLKNMRQRAERLGADLEIQSCPGGGSELRLRVRVA